MPDNIMKKEKLDLMDYLNQPIQILIAHPDFSQHAFRVANRLMIFTTEELENLDLLKGT